MPIDLDKLLKIELYKSNRVKLEINELSMSKENIEAIDYN